MKYLKKKLFKEGIIQFHIPLPEELSSLVKSRAWAEVDSLLSNYLKPSAGFLYKILIQFHDFQSIEHIIAIRNGDEDEDGIWHDDGSRHIAFTWSLNEAPECIIGGELLFRKRNQKEFLEILPSAIGSFIIFLTGEYGYEHRVMRVKKGERKTIAGWCS